MRLQAKILLVLIPLIVVPLLILGRVAYVQLQNTTVERTMREMVSVLHRFASQASSQVRTAEANIELFSNSSVTQKYLLTADAETRYSLMMPSLLRLFSSYQKAYPEYYEIRVLTPEGVEEARSTVDWLPNLTEDENESEYFLAMGETAEDAVAMFGVNPDNGRPALFVIRKVVMIDSSTDSLSRKPELRGYLAITASLSGLEKEIYTARIGNAGFVLLTRADGNTLLAPDVGIPIGQVPHHLIERAASGSGSSLEVVEMGGVRFGVTGIRIHPSLYAFAFLPMRHLQAAQSMLGSAIIAITVAAIFVTVLLLYMVLRYAIVRRIELLRRAAHEIGKGNLLVPVPDEGEDEMSELAASLRHMAENLRESNERIHYMAYHDPLTGLPNRNMFKEYLGHAIADARRQNEIMALLFLDLDNFKRINDTLGHQNGDRLLEQIAERLSHGLRETDYLARPATEHAINTVARIGGDEFVILLPAMRQPYEAGKVAGRVLKELSAPFVIDGNECYVSASIGVAVYPTDGQDIDAIFKRADVAMYHAKEQGKNNIQYFTESMNLVAFERLALENELRKALENDQLTLHYQPIFTAEDRAMVAAEALLRWEHPEMGSVSPASFIPIAEESGLIVPIGSWVLREAVRQARAWQMRGQPLRISVNCSAVQIQRESLVEELKHLLGEYSLPPDLLEIELTETAIVQGEEKAIGVLNGIRALGVHVALDDFGTGYSSLSYLRRLPIDTLKIDRSFIREIVEHDADASIIAGIIAMAASRSLTVVAEGVEKPEQLALLKILGCDLIQGFLLARPMPPEQLEKGTVPFLSQIS